MTRAFVDSSVVVAIVLGERSAPGLRTALTHFETLVATPLLVAEVTATLRREGRPVDHADAWLERLALFEPEGTLREECGAALEVGGARGADLWHVAAALQLMGKKQRRALTFVTMDVAQGKLAKKLGFAVLGPERVPRRHGLRRAQTSPRSRRAATG
jgi:predicted nucleic acid-binding protein